MTRLARYLVLLPLVIPAARADDILASAAAFAVLAGSAATRYRSDDAHRRLWRLSRNIAWTDRRDAHRGVSS